MASNKDASEATRDELDCKEKWNRHRMDNKQFL